MAIGYTGGTVTSGTFHGGGTTWRYGPGMALQSYTVVHKHSNGTTFTFEYGEQGPSQAESSVVTGAAPSQVQNFLYGKVIPLSVLGTSILGGGLERIGVAGLIFGPYFSGDIASRVASFAVSFGFPANPEGTRRVYEIALDGKVAWELAAGSPAGALDPAGFLGDPFECRFYSGTMTQGADPLESSMFGAQAVAYRPQMCLWFSNLPITAFDNKVPFVSCKIGDVTGGAVAGDGINLGTCLEAVAYSPWLEYSSADFQTSGVADIVQAMILTEDQSFLELLQTTARVYRTLDIIQTDKLRVNDRGSTVTPDVILHRDHVSADSGVQYFRQEEASVPRELELITIDPDADYVFVPTKAARPLAPVPVTSSVAKETINLPVVIGATTRASLVTYAKYQEDNARKRVSLQTLLYGYALEPGDLFRLTDIADGFDNAEVWKVVETSHGANYINEISAEAILKCAIADEVADEFVILLLHGDSDAPVIDSSGYANAMVLHGGAQIDTGITKFGAGSFLLDGTNDSVQTVESQEPEWNISPTNTSPYTIELWARFAEMPLEQNQTLICRNTGFLGRIFHLYVPSETDELIYGSSPNSLSFSAVVHTTGADLQAGIWYHIAVDKDLTGTIRVYVNGVMRGSETPTNSVMSNFLCWIAVGTESSASATIDNPFKGNIDEVRISTVSRYGDLYGNASFPVPSAPFPDPP